MPILGTAVKSPVLIKVHLSNSISMKGETMKKTPAQKLLSHRFRGFANIEHTFSGFENAINSDVKNFEVDTRVSKDGVIYVYHDPIIQGHLIAEKESSFLDTLKVYQEEKIPRLDELLKLFKEKFAEDTRLSLDIKDIGFEKQHMELIQKYGLESRIDIVSWCAKTIVNFDRLGANLPLFLSYQSLFAYGFKGMLEEFWMRNRIKIKKRIVFTGKNIFDKVPEKLYMGYMHSLRSRTLPAELLKVIQKSNGGVCVAKHLVCPALITYCKENNLRLWVYSINEINGYRRFAEMDDVEMIFSDRAEHIMEQLGK
jgi:glycerophosphoryl diester phosphodiesterase